MLFRDRIVGLLLVLTVLSLPSGAQNPGNESLISVFSFEEGEFARVGLSFEGFAHGEIVSQIGTLCGPVGVNGRNARFLPETPNAALIFDSNCRQGDPDGPPASPEDCPQNNWDLGTPNEFYGGPGRGVRGGGLTNDVALNNILIVARNLIDRDGDGLIDEPGDEARPYNNPSLYFDFSSVRDGNVTIESMDLLDVEGNNVTNGAGVQFFDSSGGLIASGLFPLTRDNGVVRGWNDWSNGPKVEGVVRMAVAMQGSAAIDNLTFTCGQEKPPPPPGDKGCSQGYWKEHRDSWPPTGFSPEQALQSVFSEVSQHYPGLAGTSLIDALNFDGGEEAEGAARILFRQAVAALLNAAHPYVAFPFTKDQVIESVNDALASQYRDTMLHLKDELDRKNNLGCPLN